MITNIMKTKAFLCAAAAGLALLAVSCDKGDGYEKGLETPDGCMAAYFTSSNESSIIMTPEEYAESDILTLNVERAVSDAAASVPIEVVIGNDKIEVPSTVEFQAGEATSSIDIKLNNLEEKVEYSFTIKIADEYVDHYTIRDGSDVYTGNIIIAKWMKVVDGGAFRFKKDYFPTTYSDIYHLDGFNRFYIENFLGSGIDLGFSIKSHNGSKFIPFSDTDKSTWKGMFQPLDHYMNDPNGYSYWWLMSDVINFEYAGWTPEGYSLGINYINFYMSDDTTYAYIDMNGYGSNNTDNGYLCSYTYLSDDSEPGYIYVYMYWKEMVKE